MSDLNLHGVLYNPGIGEIDSHARVNAEVGKEFLEGFKQRYTTLKYSDKENVLDQ